MPRNGSGVYSLPAGTSAVTGTTIESAKYNSLTQDIETDLNTDRPIAAGGTGASTASQARTNLGLAIGTDVQAYNATLTSIAALGTAADKGLYSTGANTWAEFALTAAGRALLDDADASAQRTTLGLGGLATLDILDEDDFASDSATRPPSQQSVGAFIASRDFTNPHLAVTSDAVGNVTLSPGTDHDVEFDLVLSQDTGVIPGVSLFSGDVVYLPAGTYYVEWEVTFLRPSGSNTGYYVTTLRDKTAGADLGYGLSGACSGYDRGVSTGSARFTLSAESTTIGVLADTLTNNLELVSKNASFTRPAYSRHLRLWKIG